MKQDQGPVSYASSSQELSFSEKWRCVWRDSGQRKRPNPAKHQTRSEPETGPTVRLWPPPCPPGGAVVSRLIVICVPISSSLLDRDQIPEMRRLHSRFFACALHGDGKWSIMSLLGNIEILWPLETFAANMRMSPVETNVSNCVEYNSFNSSNSKPFLHWPLKNNLHSFIFKLNYTYVAF